MTISDAAEQAVLQWARDTAITMVAIAGAESSWRNDANGDPWWAFPLDQQPTKKLYSCDGYGSIGLWQIHMPAHHARLYEVTWSTDPCVWRDALCNPGFNCIMAAEILSGQGLSAWSTYNNDAYLDYIDQATEAVDAALAPLPPALPPTPPGGAPLFGSLVPVAPPLEALPDQFWPLPVEPPR